MIWQHHSRMRWFSTDVYPFTIEIKALKSGRAIWRVVHDTTVYFSGKSDHPLTAMDTATKSTLIAKHELNHAIAKTKSQIVKEHAEKNGMEYKDIKMPLIEDMNPEDITVLPGEPSKTDH